MMVYTLLSHDRWLHLNKIAVSFSKVYSLWGLLMSQRLFLRRKTYVQLSYKILKAYVVIHI